jgi:hypothetical protein
MKLTKEQAFKQSVELGLVVETHYGCFGPFSKMMAKSFGLTADIFVEIEDPYAHEATYEATANTPDGKAFFELLGGA